MFKKILAIIPFLAVIFILAGCSNHFEDYNTIDKALSYASQANTTIASSVDSFYAEIPDYELEIKAEILKNNYTSCDSINTSKTYFSYYILLSHATSGPNYIKLLFYDTGEVELNYKASLGVVRIRYFNSSETVGKSLTGIVENKIKNSSYTKEESYAKAEATSIYDLYDRDILSNKGYYYYAPSDSLEFDDVSNFLNDKTIHYNILNDSNLNIDPLITYTFNQEDNVSWIITFSKNNIVELNYYFPYVEITSQMGVVKKYYEISDSDKEKIITQAKNMNSCYADNSFELIKMGDAIDLRLASYNAEYPKTDINTILNSQLLKGKIIDYSDGEIKKIDDNTLLKDYLKTVVYEKLPLTNNEKIMNFQYLNTIQDGYDKNDFTLSFLEDASIVLVDYSAKDELDYYSIFRMYSICEDDSKKILEIVKNQIDKA